MHIYILGSPRTGSTILYQILAKSFKNYLYMTNDCSDSYHNMPLNYFIRNHSQFVEFKKQIDFRNRFGKTKGLSNVSEGSPVFSYFFGGRHPSELFSKDLIKNKRKEFIDLHNHIQLDLEKYLMVKNAWNCFRIRSLLATKLPIFFIWIRRSLYYSALSDLNSRMRIGDPQKVWNSATTKNYRSIQKLHFTDQVIQQQFFYNSKIKKDLENYAGNNYQEIWFEDLCRNVRKTIKKIILDIKIQSPKVKIQVSYTDMPEELQKRFRHPNVANSDKMRIKHQIKQSISDYENLYKYL